MIDFGLVSIIMPVYNAEKFIKHSIESVINQTYSNWELLITDDFSTDGTSKIVEKLLLTNKQIKYYKLPCNQGPAISRNNSLKHAKGKYIAFLDSDDIWMSNKLLTQLTFMHDHRVAFSFSNYALINEKGQSLHKEIKTPSTISYKQYLRNTIIGCLTVIINREITGDFVVPNIRTSQDMALWLLILKRGYLAHGISEPLAQYRIVSNSNSAQKIRAVKDVWKVYREFEKLSILYSAYNFVGYIFNAIKKRIL